MSFNNTIDYITVLYNTLRETKKENYKPEEYKWRLGFKVIQDIDLFTFNVFKSENAPIYLYGIVVEMDYINPSNIQLFEDITNKIAIDYGDIIKLDKLEQIEKIVKQVESKHPEIAIGDREGIRKIREVLDNDASRKKS